MIGVSNDGDTMSTITRHETFVYPERDGKPMGETDSHVIEIADLFTILRDRYRNEANTYVGANMLCYYEEGIPTSTFCPDVFVVFGIPKKSRRTYKTWEEELTLLAEEPVLANYWLLAHYFLGNTDACRTTCKEAQKAKGEFTRQLALIIEQLLDKPASASLGKLKPKKLAELIKETRKNCFSEQLEPAQRKLLDAERVEAIAKNMQTLHSVLAVIELHSWKAAAAHLVNAE